MTFNLRRTAFLFAAAFPVTSLAQPLATTPNDAGARGQVQLGAGAGNGVRTPSARLSWSGERESLSYSVVASVQRQRLERMVDGGELTQSVTGQGIGARAMTQHERSHQDGLIIEPRLSWKLDNGDTLKLDSVFNVMRVRRHLDTVSTVSTGSAPLFEQVNQQFWQDEKNARSNLTWSHRISQQSRLELQLGASYGNDTQGNDWTGEDGQQQRLKRSATWSNGTDKSLTSSGKLVHALGQGHVLVGGWSLAHTQRDDARRQRETAAAGISERSTDEAYAADIEQRAFYAQDEWTVTPQWSATVGVRHDRIDLRTAGTTIANHSSTTSQFSPVAQMRYQLPDTHGDQMRVGLTRTYTVPGTRQLLPLRMLAPNNAALEPDSSGNALLQPERALVLTAGYDHHFSPPGALLKLNASTRRIDNLIKQVIRKGADGRWFATPLNSGKASHHSLDAELTVPIKTSWRAAPSIDMRSAYTRNWSKVHAVRGPDNTIPRLTPYIARLGLDLKRPALDVGASLVVRGGGLLRISEQRQRYQGVRRELDLFALFKLDKDSRVRASATLAQAWTVETSYRDGVGPSFYRTHTTPSSSSLRLVWERGF